VVGGSERVEPFAAGQHGWQVDRTPEPGMLGTPGGGGRVPRHADRRRVLGWPARPIDAPAEPACSAPLRRRRYEPGHGPWRSSVAVPRRWPLSDPSHTLLGSYADGWGWSVPVGPDSPALAAVDPTTTSLLQGRGARLSIWQKSPRWPI
jgi:hypothetical protein